MEIRKKRPQVLAVNVRFTNDEEFYDFLKDYSRQKSLSCSSFVRNFLIENLQNNFSFWKKMKSSERAESGNTE